MVTYHYKKYIISRPLFLLLVMPFLILSGCASETMPEPSQAVNQTSNDMIIKPFFSAEKVPQSPEPPSSAWRGILIQSQLEHKLTMKNRMVVLNGYYKLDGSEYPLDDDDLRIQAVNTATKATFEAAAGEKDDSPVEPDEPGPPLSRDDIRDMVFSGYFNTDILLALKLPPSGGKYRVWVTMGSIKSNEITIDIAGK